MTALAPYLSAYLREHLPRERAVSPHTVKTYANCFVLLVQFAADRLKRRPTDLEIEDLGTDMIMAFLDHVETGRGSCVRTRNGRLAAIRSFFRYIEYRIPACLDQALRVRSIPTKKTDKALIDYLDRTEIKALLDAPDPRTRLGTRDRAMLHLAYAGGLRVSELVTLQLRDFPDRSLSTVHIMGKGRRERVLPLWKETQFVLRAWLAIRPDVQAAEIFLNANGQPMTRDGFAFRLAEHVKTAATKQPSILGKRVTPHVLRHSCAMHTLAATGDMLLRTDPASGATTHLLELEIARALKPLTLKRLEELHGFAGQRQRLVRNARSGRVALLVPARSILADDGSRIARFELLRPLKRSHITEDQLTESSWEDISIDAFRDAWVVEVEEARTSHKRERLYLATGLLLPVWDKLPSDFVRVNRISAADGRSLLGREVPVHCVLDLCRALGLEREQTLSADDIVQTVLANGRAMELAGREMLMVKRSLVNGSQRLELTGWSVARLDWYKAQGCFTEIIRYQTRLFVPIEGAASVIARLASSA